MNISSYSNRIGGFVAINAGMIKDCYSDAKVKHDRNASGFVFENVGKIYTSLAQKQTTGKENIGCFYVQNKGSIEGSGWLCPSKKKKDIEYADAHMTVDADDITQISEKMGFGSAWCHPQKNDKRMELDKTLAVPEVNGKEPILIDRAEQLLQIAKAIASGDSDAASAYYKLTCDIKLSGKKWLPIGISDSTPFCGVFDGNGYSIKGFKVKAKGLAAAGFFGYIKGGKVINLTLDCVLDAAGGVLSGAMCAENAKGMLINCHVLAKVSADKICGGFVGKNEGLIERCSFVGKVSKVIPIILFFLPLIGLLLALLLIGLILLLKRFGGSPYQQEQIDVNQVPVVDTGTYAPPPAGSERISIEMNQEAYFNVDTGVGLIDFVNPKRGTKELVIRIVISDAELKRTIGRTGRTAEEQAALEATDGYDANASYQELYRSGLVQIGYSLPAAKLGTLADGTMLPEGNYEMLVVVDAYDPETHEKSVLKTQLPITIHIVKSAES